MNLHLITGASRGLGRATAEILSEAGDHVIDISRSGRYKSQRLVSFPFDLSQSPAGLIQNILSNFDLEKFDRITLTHNAATVSPVNSTDRLEAKEVLTAFQLNLISTFILTSEFLKSTHGKSRRVVFVSSGVAAHPMPNWAVYSAAKAALENFCENLTEEFADDKSVSFSSFQPGIVDTEMQAYIRSLSKSEFKEVEQFKAFKTKGRLADPKVVGKNLAKLIRT